MAIFSRHLSRVKKCYPTLGGRRLVHETIRGMINSLAIDLTQQSKINIDTVHPENPDAVRLAPCLIGFSEEIKHEKQELKSFLRENLYRHFQVMRMSNKAQHTITMLFNTFKSDIRLLPAAYQMKFSQYGYQAIADYIAGMTDRFAIKEYQRLFAINES